MSSQGNKTWPVMPGTYQVGDPNGPFAVCALTSERLISPLVSVPGVAIAGMVYTANLGITRIIVNVTSNPAIRFLLICGKDSTLFSLDNLLSLYQRKALMRRNGLSTRLVMILSYRQLIQVRWTSQEAGGGS